MFFSPSMILFTKIRPATDVLYYRSYGGAGGSRTLVQTGKPYAFYTLIPALIFELRQDPGHQPQPYPLKFRRQSGAIADYSRYCCAAEPESLGKRASERRLVLSPGGRIKPVIYCTSIRQREHSCCCQINLTTRRIKEPLANTPRAYIPSRPAVKSSQPRCSVCFRLQK